MNNLLPAFIGLIGVLVGGLISYLTNYLLKKRESQLRIVEKVFDKRIKAHEDIMTISQQLRSTVSTHTTDKHGNVLSYPYVLHSFELFDRFKGHFYEVANSNMVWVDLKVERELNYIQDYMQSLSIQLMDVPEEKYAEVGLRIKQDFIDLASSLDRLVKGFFREDVYSIKLNTSSGHHKYKKEETRRRYMASELGKNGDWLEDLKTR